MYNYNPFKKQIGLIELEDLETLRNIPEGWYIEYKQEIPNGRSIAKSISAFANTYGGWLFYGIKESDDGRRVMGALQGIPVAEVAKAEDAIRQAASSLVSPSPHFETKVIFGDATSALLPETHAVIVVGVPSGSNAPYVHGTGAIYRRVADSSEPRPETDRHFLDLLWERGKTRRSNFSKFVKRKPKLAKSEAEVSSLRILFFPDPWDEKEISTKLDFSSFSAFMGDKAHGGVTFDNVFTTRNGFMARHVQDNIPTRTLHSWRYYNDCTSEVVLPLSSRWISDLPEAMLYLKGYEHNKKFLRKCYETKITGFYLVDLSQTYSIILEIFRRKKALMEAEGLPWNLFFKVQINNFWRRVPYVDLEEASLFVEKYGIPLVQNKTAYVPAGSDPDSCWEITAPSADEEHPETQLQVDSTVLFLNVCDAVGLPWEALGIGKKSDEKRPDALARLLDLGFRAHQVNSARIKEDD
ncbi:helix-turn-helix domain-containing protein [Rhizobium sp. PP-CC-3G-465]|uniref:AlbA family DNA-binding domain-containing protein n=1 Tax=Rhizobium sp. PP-CC-3G-465 TaxID=2135648 RepID=UPI0010467994|nr:putative DNA-binding protein [Rhizobium sp. PP-CC-3G-465]